MTAFSAGAILAMIIRRRKKANPEIPVKGGRDVDDLYKIIYALWAAEERCVIAHFKIIYKYSSPVDIVCVVA